MKETKVPENNAYKVTLILLVGLAAFSTAMKDLNRLQEMVGSVKEFTSQWRGNDLVTFNEKPNSITGSCPSDPQLIHSASESGSYDAVALAGATEIERIAYEAITEPEVGGTVEPVAGKKVDRKVSRSARAGYPPAKNLKEEISAKRREGHWPARFEYKTFDRAVTLELPMTMLADIKADAVETEVAPNSPIGLLGKINRKQLPGKIDIGKREFIFKRFERVINSRRAS